MKMIGIMSDSHDNVPQVRKAVSFFNEVGCNLVIHAGDIIAPFAAHELGALRCPVKAVFGNCDGERDGLTKAFQPFGEIRPAPFYVEHGGLIFWVSHILPAGAPASRADRPFDVLVFGHTHKPEIRRKNNRLLLNPGEAGGWLTGKSTVVLFNPVSKSAEIVYL